CEHTRVRRDVSRRCCPILTVSCCHRYGMRPTSGRRRVETAWCHCSCCRPTTHDTVHRPHDATVSRSAGDKLLRLTRRQHRYPGRNRESIPSTGKRDRVRVSEG